MIEQETGIEVIDNYLYNVTIHKKNGKVLSTNSIVVSNDDIISMYDDGNRLAEQDIRLPLLLAERESQTEEPIEPKETQLDRIEKNVATLVTDVSVTDVLLGVE
jgi:hypothetical protein